MSAGAGWIPGAFNFGAPEDTGGNAQWGQASPFKGGPGESGRRTCIPLTITTVLRAYNKNPHAPKITLEGGDELGFFSLVGVVRTFEYSDDTGAQKFSLTLDDGTGLMRVDWLLGVVSEANSEFMTKEYDEMRGRLEDSTRGNTRVYVQVLGEINLKTLDARPKVKAASIRILDGPLYPFVLLHNFRALDYLTSKLIKA